MTLVRLSSSQWYDFQGLSWIQLAWIIYPRKLSVIFRSTPQPTQASPKNWDACDYLLVQRHSGFIPFQLLFGPETPPVPPDDYSLVQRHIPLRHSWCWVHCCFRGVTSSSLQFRASSPNLKIRGYLYSFSLSQISCVNYIASEKLTCSRVSSLSPLLDGPSCPAVRSRSGSA